MKRRPKECRAEILWAGVGFLLVQAVLSVGLERFWPTVRDPEFTGKQARIKTLREAAPHRPLILVMGSSRVEMGLDAGSISQSSSDGPLVFNLALSGAGPMMQRVCLERLLAAGVRPDLIVVEVVPSQLADRKGWPLEEKGLDAPRLQWRELTKLIGYYDQPHWPLWRWGKARLLPCYRHQAELNKALRLDVALEPPLEPLDRVDAFGWMPTGVTSPAERETASRMVLGKFADILAEARMADGPTCAITSLLNRCRQQGIATALLLMPEGKRMRQLYSPSFLTAVEKFLAQLSTEHGAMLIDARDWASEEDFTDTHHLHWDGAVSFTKRFAREVMGPLSDELAGSPGPQAVRGQEDRVSR